MYLETVLLSMGFLLAFKVLAIFVADTFDPMESIRKLTTSR
jgi:hypothetical protein